MKLKRSDYLLNLASMLILWTLVISSCNKNKEEKGKDHKQHQSSEQGHSVHDSAHTAEVDEENMYGMHTMDDHERSTLMEVIPSTNNWVISNQASVKLRLFDSSIAIPAQGYITYDVRRNNKMAARVGGRIERLYVKYNHEYVRKGDKILDLYSPELNTFQDEYLYLVRNSGKGEKLIEEGRKKLRLLGMTEAQINELERTGEHSYTISVFSLFTGYIILASDELGKANMNTETNSGNGMNSMGNSRVGPANVNASGQIREGMYVNSGQTLFSVNDLDKVWAIVSLETKFEPHFKLNDDFVLNSEIVPGQDIHGKVNFIEPTFKDEQRFLQVRIYLNNKDHLLKINSLVTGKIIPASHNLWMLPSSSVYDLGRRKIVWVYKGNTLKGSKLYEAREVITGIRQRDLIQVIEGIGKNEEVVMDAGYMIDSESFIGPQSNK